MSSQPVSQAERSGHFNWIFLLTGTCALPCTKHLAWNYIKVQNHAGSGVDILSQMVETGVYPNWTQEDNLPQPYEFP